MISTALFRLAIVALVAASAVGAARAGPDWHASRFAPQWLDQTVYRPDCPAVDCDCDCQSARPCLPTCVRQ